MARREQIPALTGLRFFAALWVVFHHTQYLGLATYPGLAAPAVATGRVGVDIFFVLSGFVLAYNYLDWFTGDMRRRWEFLWIRVARVAPLAWLGLLAMTALNILQIVELPRVAASAISISWLANLLLVQSLAPVDGLVLWDSPSWSVSVEMVCYFFFPALALGILRRPPSRWWAASAIITCWAFGMFCIALVAFLTPDKAVSIYFSPLSRVWEFAAGAILGAMRIHRPAVKVADRWLVLALVGFAAISLHPTTGLLAGYYWYVLAFPMSVILVALLGFGHSRTGSQLGRPWLIRLGDASYALYLMHWIAFNVLASQVSKPVSPLLLSAVILGLVVLSLALYKFFESPSRRWLRDHPPVIARTNPRRAEGSP